MAAAEPQRLDPSTRLPLSRVVRLSRWALRLWWLCWKSGPKAQKGSKGMVLRCLEPRQFGRPVVLWLPGLLASTSTHEIDLTWQDLRSRCCVLHRVTSLRSLALLQANAWQQLSPGGSAPSAQRAHAAAWSDAADGMYIFGGYDGSSSGSKRT